LFIKACLNNGPIAMKVMIALVYFQRANRIALGLFDFYVSIRLEHNATESCPEEKSSRKERLLMTWS
jgi:hypothetical protein